MSKYYINAGEIKTVLDAPDPKTAFKIAIILEVKREHPRSIDTIASVSEIGFEPHEEDFVFITEDILVELGLLSGPRMIDIINETDEVLADEDFLNKIKNDFLNPNDKPDKPDKPDKSEEN